MATGTRPGAARPLCIRWTIGDVSPAGFESLRLSVHGARRLFGPSASYVVCVNTIGVSEARRRAGPMPDWLGWRAADDSVPDWLRPHLEDGMSEGTGWKLVPPRLCPGVHELALDNDLVLWEVPKALGAWLADPSGESRIIAADVAPGHGQFAELCGLAPRNSGIRGIPARFDYEAALARVLEEKPVRLTSELDEQGLQVAAISRDAEPLTVSTREVSICSPFPPHQPELGSCGAHFVGLNAHSIPWEFHGRPATEVRLEHWHRHRPALYARLGLPMPPDKTAGRGEFVGEEAWQQP